MHKCEYIQKNLNKYLNLPNSETLFIFLQGINVAVDFNIELAYLEHNIEKNRYIINYWGGNIIKNNSEILKEKIPENIAKKINQLIKIALMIIENRPNNISVFDGWTYYFYERESNFFGSTHSPDNSSLYGKLIILIKELLKILFINKENIIPEIFELKISNLLEEFQKDGPQHITHD